MFSVVVWLFFCLLLVAKTFIIIILDWLMSTQRIFYHLYVSYSLYDSNYKQVIDFQTIQIEYKNYHEVLYILLHSSLIAHIWRSSFTKCLQSSSVSHFSSIWALFIYYIFLWGHTCYFRHFLFLVRLGSSLGLPILYHTSITDTTLFDLSSESVAQQISWTLVLLLFSSFSGTPCRQRLYHRAFLSTLFTFDSISTTFFLQSWHLFFRATFSLFNSTTT